MMHPPTSAIMALWPNPQIIPIKDDRATERSRLTNVVTAATWSASRACHMPKKNPSMMMEKTMVIRPPCSLWFEWLF
jgi:hypothetical protein